MELQFNDIQYIVQKSMEAATLATVLALEPAGAYILESDVKRWLKYNILNANGKEDGNTFNKFQSLVERGIIKGVRRGKSKHSHVYYNKAEIKRAFTEVQIEQCLTRAMNR